MTGPPSTLPHARSLGNEPPHTENGIAFGPYSSSLARSPRQPVVEGSPDNLYVARSPDRATSVTAVFLRRTPPRPPNVIGERGSDGIEFLGKYARLDHSEAPFGARGSRSKRRVPIRVGWPPRPAMASTIRYVPIGLPIGRPGNWRLRRKNV